MSIKAADLQPGDPVIVIRTGDERHWHAEIVEAVTSRYVVTDCTCWVIVDGVIAREFESTKFAHDAPAEAFGAHSDEAIQARLLRVVNEYRGAALLRELGVARDQLFAVLVDRGEIKARW